MSEFALIERIRARADADDSVLIGIGDDAAVLRTTPGLALVATTDSLVLDRHFRSDWAPSDIGHLAAAVNFSDLAAMAARPRWVLLSLTLPEADVAWLDGFLDGFLPLCRRFDTCLVGGNISSGPLNISVQLLGEVDATNATRRCNSGPGDVLAVTGALGDAAAALALGEDAPEALRRRLHRPMPRVEAGLALAGRVSAMIDVSDGLLADLSSLLGPGQGAAIDLQALPCSAALAEAYPDSTRRWPLQLTGGNDYELLLSLSASQLEPARASCAALGLALTEIGRVNRSGRLECRQPDGSLLELPQLGWDHFDSR